MIPLSFSSRYIITLFSNFIRAGLNFTVSILLARYLMPETYGNYQYITAVITSMLLLANLGTEKAYFTFISQKLRPLKFHLVYYLWQLIQLCILLLILSIIKQEWLYMIFNDTKASLLFLALIALFLSNSIQVSISNLFESIRKTGYSQALSVGTACLHLVLILLFILREELTISLLFQVIAFEYIVYLVVAIYVMKIKHFVFTVDEEFDIKNSFLEFYHYSRPLVFFMFISFLYTFFDRWLIQTYVGPEGQAFFSIAIQFSTLGILVCSSILKIFWKEISEAINDNEIDKVKKYFVHITNDLFLFTAMLSMTLYFFSRGIIDHFYGEAYADSLAVFQLIMLYTIPQALGQIYATYFMATSQIKVFTKVSLLFMAVNIPIAFLLLSDFGLGLSEKGIAAKMLISGFLVNVVFEYLISRHLKIPLQLLKKLFVLVIIFIATYLVHLFASMISENILVQALFVALFYILPVVYFLFKKLKTI